MRIIESSVITFLPWLADCVDSSNERYVVMSWKMVTRYGKNMTLKEVVDGIIDQIESKAKKYERREREREESKRSVRNTMRPI